MALVKKNTEDDQIIKPEAITPHIDTSDWPLLLKNWDQRMYSLKLHCHWNFERLTGTF